MTNKCGDCVHYNSCYGGVCATCVPEDQRRNGTLQRLEDGEETDASRCRFWVVRGTRYICRVCGCEYGPSADQPFADPSGLCEICKEEYR